MIVVVGGNGVGKYIVSTLAGGLMVGIGIWLVQSHSDASAAVIGLIGFGAFIIAFPALPAFNLSATKNGIVVSKLADRVTMVERQARANQSGISQLTEVLPDPPPLTKPQKGERLELAKDAVDPDDPQRHQWGGSPEANGRRISALVTPLNRKNTWAKSVITVRAAFGAPALSGSVTFHLHPTLDPPVQTAEVRDGEATLEIYSYGAFTVGAEADGGKTRLELDLSTQPGAAPPWSEN